VGGEIKFFNYTILGNLEKNTGGRGSSLGSRVGDNEDKSLVLGGLRAKGGGGPKHPQQGTGAFRNQREAIKI